MLHSFVFFLWGFFFVGTGAGNGGRIVRWTLACSACTETWALWCFSEHTCCLIREHTKQQMRHPGVSKWFQDKSHHHVIILVIRVQGILRLFFFARVSWRIGWGGFSAPLLFFSSTLIVCVMWRLQCGRELFCLLQRQCELAWPIARWFIHQACTGDNNIWPQQ